MDTQGQEVGKIEKRLRQLGAKLDKLAAQAVDAGADAKLDYRRQIDLIKDKHELVRRRLDAFKAANGQKWENFRTGVESAWHELENAFKALKQASPPRDSESASAQKTDDPSQTTPSD